MGEGRSSGFGSLVRKGRAPGIGRRCLRISGGVGSKGCGSSLPMIFFGWRRRLRIFPEMDWQRCVPQAVRDTLAEDLKKIYWAESQEAEEAFRNLRERWGTVYPKIVEHSQTRA